MEDFFGRFLWEDFLLGGILWEKVFVYIGIDLFVKILVFVKILSQWRRTRIYILRSARQAHCTKKSKNQKQITLELCWRLKIGKAAQCIFVHFFALTHKIGIFRIPIHVGQALVSLGVNQALSHHSSHGRPQR